MWMGTEIQTPIFVRAVNTITKEGQFHIQEVLVPSDFQEHIFKCDYRTISWFKKTATFEKTAR